MSKQKRITCRGHCPIFVDPDYKQPWADVWIRFKARPGRAFEFGPTLMTKQDVEAHLKITEECQAEHPEFDYGKDIADARRALAALEVSDVYVDPEIHHGPEIYTSRDGIDRNEAERMLSAFVARYGYKNLKFVWKRPKIVAVPV